MSHEKYIGMDVHQATIWVAVMDAGRQVDHGMPTGDRGGHDRRVHPRAADTTPFPYQASAMGLQWFRPSRLTTAGSTATCEANCNATASSSRYAVWMTTTIKIWRISSKVLLYPPAPALAPARLLCRSGWERDAANDGPSYLGTEDCRDQFNHLEERSGIRRPTIASTSSLSIS